MYRDRIRWRVNELRMAVKLLTDLRESVTSKNESLDTDMEELQRILTPKQTLRFILWVDNNPACMNMLNKLWANMQKPPSS